MAEILIVDDDPQMRRLLTRTLTAAGHTVHEAANGADAIALFRRVRPPLVITDIVMPGKEGIETILELRREAPAVAILAISGGGQNHSMSYLEFATKLGADAALPKPFGAAALIETVNRLLPPSALPEID